ncbi:hypothetical protein D9M71_744660 [compost metagenome]
MRRALETGPEQLDGPTKLALLSDPVALSRLHQQVWEGGRDNWLAPWRQSLQADAHAPAVPLAPLPGSEAVPLASQA